MSITLNIEFIDKESIIIEGSNGGNCHSMAWTGKKVATSKEKALALVHEWMEKAGWQGGFD